ncbi:MAG TPA: hypothetical protein VMW10_10075 [Alphaproteobacteria bacterium]|nr:hypothetical protein [Alphaproteobacteria bacterium]
MWRILFLLAFINEAQANFKNVAADVKEDPDKAAISARSSELREDDGKEAREKETRVRDEDINALPNQVVTGVSGEVEKPSPFLGRNETPSAPGAEQRLIKVEYLDPNVSFPVADAPWWEQWWSSLKRWWALETTQ